MLDLKFVRENPEIIRSALRRRRSDFDFDRFLKMDGERLVLLREVEEMRAKQNRASEEIARSEGAEREVRLSELRNLKEVLRPKEDWIS